MVYGPPFFDMVGSWFSRVEVAGAVLLPVPAFAGIYLRQGVGEEGPCAGSIIGEIQHMHAAQSTHKNSFFVLLRQLECVHKYDNVTYLHI